MATTVYYNDVTLHNVVTRNWNEECVYDQSGTDLLSQKFSLTFEGIVHAATPGVAYIAESRQGLTPYETGVAGMKAIRRLLEQPRGELLVDVNGTALLRCVATTEATAFDPDRDVDNGPKPKGVTISRVVNDTYRVAFAVECCKVECTDGRPVGPVLNNRWSVSESMDADYFTERTISGRIRCSGTVDTAAFRPFCIPDLEDGFKREKIDYAVSANLLDADYSITDKQVHYSPPWPATKFEITHNEETGSGFEFFSDVSVNVEGHPGASKKDLISIAVMMAESRLQLAGKEHGSNYMLESAAIVDHIGERNQVSFRMRIKSLLDKDSLGEWLTNLKKSIGSDLELPRITSTVDKNGNVIAAAYDKIKSWPPNAYGYIPHGSQRSPAALFIFHCFLQKPCDNTHGIQEVPKAEYNQPSNENEFQQGEVQVMGRQVEQLPDAPEDQYTLEARESLYTYARAETNWTADGVRAHLPLARIYEAQEVPGDEDTAVIVEIGPVMSKQVVTWDAERVGKWPEIMNPVDSWEDGSLKGKLINHWVRGFPARICADGHQKTFRLTAHYEYALNRRPTETEKHHMGRLPNLKEVQDEEVMIPNEVYSEGINVYSHTAQPGGNQQSFSR